VSSATPYDPQSAFDAVVSAAVDTRMLDIGKQFGLTSRQRALNSLWSRYRTLQYEGRKVAWDGTRASSSDETEQVASEGFLPPGFVDSSGATLPIRFRKPSAPYHLFRVIVDRFTSLLFNERRHPQLHVEGDEETEKFIRALWDTARGWSAMMKARAYGGAQGSVALGFQFIKGKPTIEVHDPRWLFPEFSDRFGLTVRKIEKRMQYPQEKATPRGYETVQMWYRRVIDDRWDVTFKPCEVTEREPLWEPDPNATFEHKLGFCPIVWVQNLPVDDDIDGAPDCEGCLDVLDALDQTLSQTHKGVNANADPTLVIKADGEVGKEITTGSDNAIKLPSSGDVHYLELSGSSITTGLTMATELRRIALEVSQCVLDANQTGSGTTATEIERSYSSMLAKGGMLREQYGQKGILPLLGMMLKAAKALGTAKALDGAIVRGGIRLSGWDGPKVQNGLALIPPNLPDDPDVSLSWPEFLEPGVADVAQAVTAAVTAKAGGLIDAEHATKFVASYFHVEDPAAMMAKVEQEGAQDDVAAQSLSALNNPGSSGKGTPAPPGGFIKGTQIPAEAG
jgi:hypothetical protein